MKKKKVYYIIDDIYNGGGIARVTLLMAGELIKTGRYDVSIVSMSHPLETPYYKIPDGCRVIDLPLKNFIIRKDFIRAATELKRLFPSDLEGTFIIDDVGHNIPAWLGLKHCKKARFISWSHTNFFNGSKYGFSGIGKRLAVKRFHYLVALTKEDMGYYKKILNADNVIQIYNPKDPSIQRQKYDPGSKKIITCGRLSREKGFDILLQVAQGVFEKVKDWQWDIYGDGPEYTAIRQRIKEYGLEGKVNLMGYHKDILRLYQDYAFYVFISRGEGCPMAMIEALSAGLPMISFDFKCGPKDLIVDGVNGYIIKNQDVDEMAEKVLKLTMDQERRCGFAEHTDMNLSELEMSYVLDKWESIL